MLRTTCRVFPAIAAAALLGGCFPSHQGRARSELASGKYAEAIVDYDAAISEAASDQQKSRLEAKRQEACAGLLKAGIAHATTLEQKDDGGEAAAGAFDTLLTRVNELKCAGLDEEIGTGYVKSMARLLEKRTADGRAKVAGDPATAFVDLRRLQAQATWVSDNASTVAWKAKFQLIARDAEAGALEAAGLLADRELKGARELAATGKRWEAFARLVELRRVEASWGLSKAKHDELVADLASLAQALFPEVEAMEAPNAYPKAVALARYLSSPFPADHDLSKFFAMRMSSRAALFHMEQAKKLQVAFAAQLLHLELAAAYGLPLPVLQQLRDYGRGGEKGSWEVVINGRVAPEVVYPEPKLLAECSDERVTVRHSEKADELCRAGAGLDTDAVQAARRKIAGLKDQDAHGLRVKREEFDCGFFEQAPALIEARAGYAFKVELDLQRCTRTQVLVPENAQRGVAAGFNERLGVVSVWVMEGSFKITSRTGRTVSRPVKIRQEDVADKMGSAGDVGSYSAAYAAELGHNVRAHGLQELAAQMYEAADKLGQESAEESLKKAEEAQKKGDLLAAESAFAEATRHAAKLSPAAAAFYASQYGLSAEQAAAALLTQPITLTAQVPVPAGAEKLPEPDKSPVRPWVPREPTTAELVELPKLAPLPPPAAQALYRNGALLGVGLNQSPFDGRVAMPLMAEASDKDIRVYGQLDLPIPGGWGFALGGEQPFFGGEKFEINWGFQYRQHSADDDRALRELGLTVGARASVSDWLQFDATWRPNLLWLKDQLAGESDVLHPSPLEFGATALFSEKYFARLQATRTAGKDANVKAAAVQAIVGMHWPD